MAGSTSIQAKWMAFKLGCRRPLLLLQPQLQLYVIRTRLGSTARQWCDGGGAGGALQQYVVVLLCVSGRPSTVCGFV